ncbi:MAG: hypothetical protein ABIL09_17305 [Gemmatimonadota bacterium]
MWLGISAVAVAIVYALVKFVTAVHIRRLRDERVRLHYDLKRALQRLESLEGKLQVDRSSKGLVEQKSQTARRFKDEMYARLRVELPEPLLPELRRCINRNPVPEPRGVRLFHDLKLADRIAAALEAVSVIVFELRDGGAPESAVIKGQLLQSLKLGAVPFASPEPRDEDESEERLVAAFDDAEKAMGFARQFASQAAAEHLGRLQGVLMAGVSRGGEGEGDLGRAFARSLELAQQLADTAPPGCLLINAAAHDSLADRSGVEVFSKVEKLYSWAWQVAPAPAGPSPPGAPTAIPEALPGPGEDAGPPPPQEGDSA